jgi:hypothetical protein
MERACGVDLRNVDIVSKKIIKKCAVLKCQYYSSSTLRPLKPDVNQKLVFVRCRDFCIFLFFFFVFCDKRFFKSALKTNEETRKV